MTSKEGQRFGVIDGEGQKRPMTLVYKGETYTLYSGRYYRLGSILGKSTTSTKGTEQLVPGEDAKEITDPELIAKLAEARIWTQEDGSLPALEGEQTHPVSYSDRDYLFCEGVFYDITDSNSLYIESRTNIIRPVTKKEGGNARKVSDNKLIKILTAIKDDNYDSVTIK